MLKIVKTENGLVRGISSADPRIISFKGIPFAAPPVGNLRWKAPQPAGNWDGIRDCLEFAPISMQSTPGLDESSIYTREWNVDPEIPMSEDCLYLNVWTPAKSAGEKLPVYVWYFGGALQWGNTAEMEFDGERLARRGIVVVTVNYRINVFGFFAHPQLLEEAPGAPANFGHLDQQAGLFWTRRNIEAFGGDPDNITIGGQSAGGGSVLTQLCCRENHPYIQKAIVESGIFLDPSHNIHKKSMEEALRQGEFFFARLGVKTLEEARKLPAEVISKENTEWGVYWGTVPDGVFQTDTFWGSLQAGKFPDIPLLMGYTDHEFLTNAKEYIPTLEGKKEVINSIELAIRVLCRRLEAMHKKTPNFVYEFGADIPGWDNPGAFHSSDLWFFFETLAKCWRPFKGTHYDLSRQMCNYWAEFIKKGNPNGEDVDGSLMEHWDEFTDQNPRVMTFVDTPRMKNGTDGKCMRFLKEHMSIQDY